MWCAHTRALISQCEHLAVMWTVNNQQTGFIWKHLDTSASSSCLFVFSASQCCCCLPFRGPEDTCFEGGVFPAVLSFPSDYPLSPPKMRFTCDMFHPNSKASGSAPSPVCCWLIWMHSDSYSEVSNQSRDSSLLSEDSPSAGSQKQLVTWPGEVETFSCSQKPAETFSLTVTRHWTRPNTPPLACC